MKRLMLIVILMLVAVLSACGSPANNSSKIVISDPWTYAAGGGMGDSAKEGETSKSNGAAFMVIKNSGAEADRLVKAESTVADAVEIHKTEMVDDVMKMAPVDGIDIPAKGQVELKPGSFHVMFIGLNQELKAGEKVQVTLTFEKAGQQTIEAEVRNP